MAALTRSGGLAGLGVTSLQERVARQSGSGHNQSPLQSVWSLTGTAEIQQDKKHVKTCFQKGLLATETEKMMAAFKKNQKF